MKNLKKSIALFLAFAMVLTLCPIKSNAKWRDQSRNLPGFATDKEKRQATIIAISGGVIIVGAVAYYFIRKHKIQKTNSQTGSYLNNNMPFSYRKDSPSNISNLSFNTESSFLQKVETTSRSMPIDLIIAPVNSVHNLALGNTNGIQLGLRIRF